MLSHHQAKAAQFRILSAQARETALASPLPQVRETQARAAERWDALALFEDLHVEGALARAAALPGCAAATDAPPITAAGTTTPAPAASEAEG